MQAHQKSADAIRSAIIAGRPEATGRPADALLSLLDGEHFPSSWQGPLDRMRASALRVKNSSDVASVAAAVADVGTSCGWCHQKHGGPRSEPVDPPMDDGTLAARMKRHAWASERLWEGLFVPSSRAWQVGAVTLREEPFPEEMLEKGGVYAKSAASDFSKVVARAAGASTPSARAEVYANLLGTCATCHLAVER